MMEAIQRWTIAVQLRFQELKENERGQALVEYGLILGLVSVVAIGALELVGQNVLSKLNAVANAI
jgi:pilus assembly protein Flp/PilA